MLFIETPEFSRHLPAHLDDESYAALQAFLSGYPTAGQVIRGAGGIRKIRWARSGQGKRSGIRVIYYWHAAQQHIYLLTVYGKSVKDDARRLTATRSRTLARSRTGVEKCNLSVSIERSQGTK